MKLLKLKMDKITTNPNQPRKYFDDEKLEELRESIKNNGLIQPIIVRKVNEGYNKGKYEIIAGERRYRACTLLEMEEIDAIQIDAGDSKSYEYSVLENIQRENLNPIEEAESYVMLMQVYKYNQEKLAEKLGKTRSSISNKIRILKLPEEVKMLVRNGMLSYGHARTILSLNNSEKIVDLSKKVIEKKYSVRELEKIVKKYNEENEKRVKLFEIKQENKEKNIEEENSSEKNFIEEKLREFFETKVSIKGKIEENGKIEIEFYSYEDLSRIIELIGVNFD